MCLLSVITATSAAADVVAVPFLCKVERGRIVIKPGPEHTYDIFAPRRQRPYQHCTGPNNSRCQMRMLHQFDISCGGARVSWLAVAAAASRHIGREAWVDGGRLHIATDPSPTSASSGCDEVPLSLETIFGSSQQAQIERPCRPRAADRSGARVVSLPPGFAPLADVGARLVISMPLPSASAASNAALPLVLEPEQPDPDEPVITAALPIPVIAPPVLLPSEPREEAVPTQPSDALQEKVPDVEMADARKALEGFSAWIVTVRQERAQAATAPGPAVRATLGGDQWLFLLGVLTATLAAVGCYLRFGSGLASGVQRIRRAQSTALGPFTRNRARLVPTDAAADSAHIIEQLRDTAVQLRHNADLILEDLRSAPPLRGVLRQELDLIGVRLSEAPILNGAEPTARQTRQRLQTGIRELHRMIKIAEGAAASFAAGAARPAMPHSRDEAFALLGVNDSVNDATLKKVVDALRVSWHPDHARDDLDRELREERLKQINVAWDLITGRRLSA